MNRISNLVNPIYTADTKGSNYPVRDFNLHGHSFAFLKKGSDWFIVNKKQPGIVLGAVKDPNDPAEIRRFESTFSKNIEQQKIAQSSNNVPGMVNAEELRYLFDLYKNNRAVQNQLFQRGSSPNEPRQKNISENVPRLAVSAFNTYLNGAGGTFRLPAGTLVSSPTYFKEPANKNVNELLDNIFQAKSRTPGTEEITKKMAALKDGGSFSFNDYQSKLVSVDVFKAQKLSPIDQQLWGTLGDITLNSNINATITYDAKQNMYVMKVKVVTAYIDRYDWNAKANDRPEATTKTTSLPGGKYGPVVKLNHADFNNMRNFGAADFNIVELVKQEKTFYIPASNIKADLSNPFSIPRAWELGSELRLEKLEQKHLATVKEIKDPKLVLQHLKRAISQNPKLKISIPAGGPVKELPLQQVHTNPGPLPKVDPTLQRQMREKQQEEGFPLPPTIL